VVTVPVATRVATFGQPGEVAQHRKHVPTRANTGGSKQTRTADPLLVRHRQRVRARPRTSDFPCR
jgi:hypothetical protein